MPWNHYFMFNVSFDEYGQSFEEESDTSMYLQNMANRCPVCQRKNSPLHIHVIDEQEDAHIVHLECQMCSCRMLAVFSLGKFGASSIGFITDLDVRDVERFLGAPHVSADDVLQLVESLA